MTVTEEGAKVRGAELARRLRTALHEGNVRRIIVKDAHGRTVMEVPLTAGAVAFVAAPFLTVLAGLAAVGAEWTIRVERRIEDAGNADASVGVEVVPDDTSKAPVA
ncbi:DUF4342 domain-containing protein [Nonomuraea maheshkhaliensis]|uniref:DUF4342 domain-containing protein n=1 Tax=Nonomuraea maheshkhaliensis TaxID=419590 RepID=A0ABN2HY31_9ACTN